jgi:alkylresorcinol/alkylpyrone synthase
MTARTCAQSVELLSPSCHANPWDFASAGPPITISAISTALPRHIVGIDEVKAFVNRTFPLSEARTSMMYEIIENAKVEQRYSVFPPSYTIEPRSLTQTTQEYQEHAITLGRRAAAQCLEDAGVAPVDVDMIVTVSCTGLIIPSLDAHLVNDLGFRSDVRRVPLTELGCSGGAAALGRAWDFLKGVQEGKVLVVSVELPSLTFQRRDISTANLISSILFGDGAVALLMTRNTAPESLAASSSGLCRPAIIGAQTHLVPNTLEALGFDLKDDGLHIVLSQDVPVLIREKFRGLVENFLARHGLCQQDISAFILHAGGQKLLTFIEQDLGLSRELTQYSWDVLRDYGNQSSASVLFVLNEWVKKSNLPAGRYGFLAAFGPGFTVDMMLLKFL